MEENTGEEQLGYRKSKGIRDVIGCLRMPASVIEVTRYVFVCFVDWEKDSIELILKCS